MSRVPLLEAELKRVFSDVSGLPVAELTREATFVDQGLDSLSLTQVTLEIERVFGLKLRFRRMLEDLDNVARLAALLDRELPAGRFVPAPLAVPVVATAAPAVAQMLVPAVQGDSLIHQLIQQQMQLMAQQLALLSGSPAPVAAPALAAPATTSAAPVSTADDGSEPSIKALVDKPFGASPHRILQAGQGADPLPARQLLAPRSATVHGMIAAQAARTPAAPAVLQPCFGELSHGELHERSNRLAHALRVRGVARGALVGLCIERGLDMLVAQLAILKAGAAYVPLDPAYPGDRLTYMAEDAQLALLVSESSLVHALHWPREKTLLLDIDVASIVSMPDAAPPPDAALDAQPLDPAYVIYTSDSTGTPKGVAVHHQAVVNFLASMAREPGLKSSDTLLAVTTLSFDIAVLELLLPLTVGAKIVLTSRDDARDGGVLAAMLAEHGVTVMQATPSSWRMLIESGWGPTPGLKALVGGEGLSADLAEQLLERCGELWNMYGPIETTMWPTCWRVEHPQPQHFVELDAIPLLPNGKVNRKVLPVSSADQDTTHDCADFAVPANATEQAIAAIWARLLNVTQVGRNDNFFNLGGHSLLALRAVQAIQRITGEKIAASRLIFESLGQIAAGIAIEPACAAPTGSLPAEVHAGSGAANELPMIPSRPHWLVRLRRKWS